MSDYSLEEALAVADNTTEESFVIDSDLRTIQGPQKYVLGVFNDRISVLEENQQIIIAALAEIIGG